MVDDENSFSHVIIIVFAIANVFLLMYFNYSDDQGRYVCTGSDV